MCERCEAGEADGVSALAGLGAQGDVITEDLNGNLLLSIGRELREPVVRWLGGACATLEHGRRGIADLVFGEGFGGLACDDGAFTRGWMHATGQAHDARWIGNGGVSAGFWSNKLD